MGAANRCVDNIRLSHFSLLNRLRPALIEELLAHSTIERLPPGRTLFTRDETDHRTHFLLHGQLALISAHQGTRTLKADAPEATQPVDDHHPHRVTALARTRVTVLSVDSAVLDTLLRRNEATPDTTGPAPHQAEGRIDRIFSTPLFARLPRAHRQVLKNRVTEIPVRAGEVIIREGDDSRYYHIITEGRCSVTRRLGRLGRQVVLASLHAGDGFGEGTLIANGRHDATVTAMEDSRLLRFTKGEFLTLLARPYIKWIPYPEVVALQGQGAVLIDVRSPEAFHKGHLDGSINLPLRILRQAAPLLDKGRSYIVCCDTGRRSATAAFVLAGQGMEARILSDGLRGALRAQTRPQGHSRFSAPPPPSDGNNAIHRQAGRDLPA